MAGDWLKFEKATLDKPEVFAIAERTGLDPDAVLGKLLRVWSWFDTHTVDGDARCVTPALLDRVSAHPGFVTEMAAVGWLVVTNEGVTLPNFTRHNGETAKKRALTANRMKNKRSRDAKSDAKSDASNVTDASPREEKRREELTPTDSPSHPTRARAGACEGRVGVWEGHSGEDGAGDEPAVPVGAKVSPYARAAIALREAGVRCTSQNPDLIAAVDAGVTPEHLVEVAAQYPGKPVRYVCVVALRELRERSAPESVRAVEAGATKPRPLAPSRQAQAIAGLLHATPPDHEVRHGDEHPRLVHEGHR